LHSGKQVCLLKSNYTVLRLKKLKLVWVKVAEMYILTALLLVCSIGLAFGQTVKNTIQKSDSVVSLTEYMPIIWPDSIGISYFQKLRLNKQAGEGDINGITNSLLTIAENNGYAFARVTPYFIIEDQKRRLGFGVVNGPSFKWDTLTISPKAIIKRRFLERYLYLIPGERYTQERIRSVARAINQLPYVQQVEPLSFAFEGTKASGQLFLKSRKANQADGVIGFLPNERQQGKLLLNGEINLKLYNLFRTGKSLVFEWRSTRPGSLKLLADYVHPVLFRTHWEFQANLQLQKEDSSFFNRNGKLTLLYQFENGTKAGFFVRNLRSSILLQNSVLAEGNSGNLQGTQYIELGGGIEKNNLSDYFSPRRGIYLKAEGGFGNKKIQAPLADSLSQSPTEVTKSKQFTGKLAFQRYTSLSPKTTLLVKMQASGMFNSQLKRNELLRLGGLQTMRGFAENYFFCSKYAVSSLECLYYLEDNSTIGLFLDQAIVERSLLQKNITDYPTAIGILVKLNAKAGIFNLAYALGRNADAGFGFSTAVVHFGVSGRF